MTIINRDIDNAVVIMQEAAKWLIDTGRLLWNTEDLTKEKLLKNFDISAFYTGRENNIPVAAMILIWHDPFFWKNIKPDESGFIHKLSIKREFAGKGYAKLMIDFVASECRKKNINYLRLDCDAGRDKLCCFYEKAGFIQVDRKMIGIYDTAFYEKKL